MNKNYNFERKKLNLPEYGRNILQMVDFLLNIEDREIRNQQARVVIDVMGNINTHLRDTDDLKHKLWDHLFIISDFKLDVDSPYPKPSPDSITPHPEKLSYPKKKIAYKHYGKNVNEMIQVLRGVDDEESRAIIINNIAKYMRNKSHEYNQEHPNNEIIINDIRRMSGNEITIEDDILDSSKSEFKPVIVNPRLRSSKPPQKNGYQKNNTNNSSSNSNQGRKVFQKKMR